MGQLIDGEQDGQPNSASTGDDLMTSNDEDGVAFTTNLTPGSTASVAIDMTTWF